MTAGAYTCIKSFKFTNTTQTNNEYVFPPLISRNISVYTQFSLSSHVTIIWLNTYD